MEHIVFFPGPDGAPSFRRLSSLDDAVRLVEHLRNVENVSEVSVHTLAPVPLSFRPYYRVEVPAGEAAPEPRFAPGAGAGPGGPRPPGPLGPGGRAAAGERAGGRGRAGGQR